MRSADETHNLLNRMETAMARIRGDVLGAFPYDDPFRSRWERSSRLGPEGVADMVRAYVEERSGG